MMQSTSTLELMRGKKNTTLDI